MEPAHASADTPAALFARALRGPDPDVGHGEPVDTGPTAHCDADPEAALRRLDAFCDAPADRPLIPYDPNPPRLKPYPVSISCQLLDIAGFCDVRLSRSRHMVQANLYLDDDEAVAQLIDDAINKFAVPADDLRKLRYEIEELLRHERWQFETRQSHAVVKSLAEAAAYEVSWLWPNRIAADKLTMLVGDPGVGKSLLSLDVAARVTTGAPWPDDPPGTERREPGGVLLLSELDDRDDTLRPRLEALGADLARVSLLNSFHHVDDRGNGKTVAFSVGGKLKMIEDCIDKVPDCQLVVIDPLSAYIDANYTRRDLTGLIDDLVEIAVSKGVAILLVSHFSRGSHALFHYGSQANSRFVASARSVWKIVGDHEFPTRRLLLPLKNNLGDDWHGLGFRIESATADPAPRITWENKPLAIKVERTMFEPEKPKVLANGYEIRRRAVNAWLRDQLQAGERFIQDVLAEATLARIGQRSLRRALREIGVTTRKGSTGLWVWALANKSVTDACEVAQLTNGAQNPSKVGES